MMKRLMIAVSLGIAGLTAVLVQQQRQAATMFVQQAQPIRQTATTTEVDPWRSNDGVTVEVPLPVNVLGRLAG